APQGSPARPRRPRPRFALEGSDSGAQAGAASLAFDRADQPLRARLHQRAAARRRTGRGLRVAAALSRATTDYSKIRSTGPGDRDWDLVRFLFDPPGALRKVRLVYAHDGNPLLARCSGRARRGFDHGRGTKRLDPNWSLRRSHPALRCLPEGVSEEGSLP